MSNPIPAPLMASKKKPVNGFAFTAFFLLLGTIIALLWSASFAYITYLAKAPGYNDFPQWLHSNWFSILTATPLPLPAILISLIIAHIALTRKRRTYWGKTFAVITLIIDYLLLAAALTLFGLFLLLLAAFQNYQF